MPSNNGRRFWYDRLWVGSEDDNTINARETLQSSSGMAAQQRTLAQQQGLASGASLSQQQSTRGGAGGSGYSGLGDLIYNSPFGVFQISYRRPQSIPFPRGESFIKGLNYMSTSYIKEIIIPDLIFQEVLGHLGTNPTADKEEPITFINYHGFMIKNEKYQFCLDKYIEDITAETEVV